MREQSPSVLNYLFLDFAVAFVSKKPLLLNRGGCESELAGDEFTYLRASGRYNQNTPGVSRGENINERENTNYP